MQTFAYLSKFYVKGPKFMTFSNFHCAATYLLDTNFHEFIIYIASYVLYIAKDATIHNLGVSTYYHLCIIMQ